MLAVLCGASSFVAPVSPARSVVAQRSAVTTMGLFPEGLLKTVEFLNKPADEDDGEEVCYLDTESEAGYTFAAGRRRRTRTGGTNTTGPRARARRPS